MLSYYPMRASKPTKTVATAAAEAPNKKLL